MRVKIFNWVFGFISLATTFICYGLSFIPWSSKLIRLIVFGYSKLAVFCSSSILGLKFEFRNFKNIYRRGAFILAPKHASYMDSIALYSRGIDATFVLGKTTADLPLFRRIVPKLRIIVVDENGGAAALKKLIQDIEALKEDKRRIVIYPEGGFSVGDDRMSYKVGTFVIYRKLGIPCYPVACNLGKFWPRNTPDKKEGLAVLEVLEPFSGSMTKGLFMGNLSDRIESATARLWGLNTETKQNYNIDILEESRVV